MPLYYYGFDIYYLLLVVPAIIIAIWAQIKVKTTFNKYSKQIATYNITGEKAAQIVLDHNNVQGVKIEPIAGDLTDHFDPKTNIIRLSDATFDSNSVAAIGVAAHEAGHAVQHAQAYAPIRIRNLFVPIAQIGTTLSWPLLLIGFIFNFSNLILLGIVFFSAAVLFQILTLPVEFNASHRALISIENAQILTDSEIVGARKTLSAAAMTYVAALLTSLAQLLRLILIFNGRNND